MNIYSVAKKCGVSTATVSRVINGTGSVSEKTKSKVLEVIRKTDFTPNPFARGLNVNSMRLVGVLCTDFGDTFFSQAVSFLEGMLREKDLHVLLVCTGYDISGKKQGLSDLVKKNVDAIVLIGTVFKERDNAHIEEVAKKVPIFTVNSVIDADNVYSVKCDEERAAEMAVTELLNAGCTSPLYLYEKTDYGNIDKLQGYRNAFNKAGLTPPEHLFAKVKSDKESIDELIGQYAQNYAFDSVFAANDSLAAFAIKALNKRNIKLPVIGFNNSPLAELLSPELTSVDNMLMDMCATTVSRLVDVIDGKTPPKNTLLSGRLIRRETF